MRHLTIFIIVFVTSACSTSQQMKDEQKTNESRYAHYEAMSQDKKNIISSLLLSLEQASFVDSVTEYQMYLDHAFDDMKVPCERVEFKSNLYHDEINDLLEGHIESYGYVYDEANDRWNHEKREEYVEFYLVVGRRQDAWRVNVIKIGLKYK